MGQARVTHSVNHPMILAEVLISQFVGSRPTSGSWIPVQGLIGILSTSLCPSPAHLCSLKINTLKNHKQKQKKHPPSVIG